MQGARAVRHPMSPVNQEWRAEAEERRRSFREWGNPKITRQGAIVIVWEAKRFWIAINAANATDAAEAANANAAQLAAARHFLAAEPAVPAVPRLPPPRQQHGLHVHGYIRAVVRQRKHAGPRTDEQQLFPVSLIVNYPLTHQSVMLEWLPSQFGPARAEFLLQPHQRCQV